MLRICSLLICWIGVSDRWCGQLSTRIWLLCLDLWPLLMSHMMFMMIFCHVVRFPHGFVERINEVLTAMSDWLSRKWDQRKSLMDRFEDVTLYPFEKWRQDPCLTRVNHSGSKGSYWYLGRNRIEIKLGSVDSSSHDVGLVGWQWQATMSRIRSWFPS